MYKNDPELGISGDLNQRKLKLEEYEQAALLILPEEEKERFVTFALKLKETIHTLNFYIQAMDNKELLEQQIELQDAESQEVNVESLQEKLQQANNKLEEARAKHLEKLSEEEKTNFASEEKEIEIKKVTFQYQLAKQEEVNAWCEVNHLDELKQVEADQLFDMAAEALGETRTSYEMAEYLVSLVRAQGVELSQSDLTEFKAAFIQDDLKATFGAFWRKHIDAHVVTKSEMAAQQHKDKAIKLGNVKIKLNNVSPEECVQDVEQEIAQDLQSKQEQYATLMAEKNQSIKEVALINAQYANFLHLSEKLYQTELAFIDATAQLEQTKIEADAEITKMSQVYTQAKINYESRKQQTDVDLIFDQVNAALKGGEKTKGDDRKHATHIMINVLVSTGLITHDMAVKKYDEVFYESLKFKNAEFAANVKQVFEQAQKEVLSETKATVDFADRYIEECQLKIESVAEILKVTSDAFDQQNLQAQKYEETVLLQLPSSAQEKFKAFSVEIKDSSSVFNNFVRAMNNKLVLERQIELNSEKSALVPLQEKLQNLNSVLEATKALYLERLTPEEKADFFEKEKAVDIEKQNAKETEEIKLAALKAVPAFQSSPHIAINSVIDRGFQLYEDRNQLANFLVNELTRMYYELYPSVNEQDLKTIDKALLLHEISKDELSGFHKHEERTKKRLYDYFFGKLTHTDKKRHGHRWEHVFKPIVNEISKKCIGWRPFKDFNGGEEGNDEPNFQFTYNSHGQFHIDYQAGQNRIFRLYESDRPTPKLLEPKQPAIFEKNFKLTTENQSIAQTSIEGMSMAPSFPSLMNLALEGSIFGASTQDLYPGPFSLENLPESVKNPSASSHIMVPFAMQEKAQKAYIISLDPTAERLPAPASAFPAAQAVNSGGWSMLNNKQEKSPLAFLPSYNNGTMMSPSVLELARAGQPPSAPQTVPNTTVLSENPSEEPQSTGKKALSPNQKATSLAMNALEKVVPAASAGEIPNAKHNSTKPTSEFVTDEYLDASLGEKLLIGSGRAFVQTGQGIKQLGLAAGEKLGIVADGTTAKYTDEINSEKSLYEGTTVGKSATAKVGEILTDVSIAVALPGGAGITGMKMVVQSAGVGAFIGGMQATEDGSLSSRAKNSAIGAVEGAVGGYVFRKTAQGLHWTWQEGKVQHGLYTFDSKVKVDHVFSTAKGGQAPKRGHVYDTPENRKIIVETYTDKKNFVLKDEHGKELFAKLLSDGTESWAYVRNGKVKSAGVNNIPKHQEIKKISNLSVPKIPGNMP